MLNAPFDFIQDPKGIFEALLESKDKGSAIGIKTAALGRGLFVIGVQDILLGDGNDHTQIVLKGHDFTGHILETNRIKLSDIEEVCIFPFKFS